MRPFLAFLALILAVGVTAQDASPAPAAEFEVEGQAETIALKNELQLAREKYARVSATLQSLKTEFNNMVAKSVEGNGDDLELAKGVAKQVQMSLEEIQGNFTAMADDAFGLLRDRIDQACEANGWVRPGDNETVSADDTTGKNTA